MATRWLAGVLTIAVVGAPAGIAEAGTTERVSVDSAEGQADVFAAPGGATVGSFGASISSDGRFVAFESNATDLVAGDTNGTTDVFVRDRLFAVTTALGVALSAALPLGDTWTAGAVAVSGEAIEAVLVDRFVDVAATTELYRVRIPAGGLQDSAPHAPGVTEHWIVYAGALELGPIEEPVRLGAGESTTFAGDVPHRYRVDGDDDVAATLLVRYPAAR